MYIHDLNRLMSWWTVVLCLNILKTFRNLFLHMISNCGHVSLSFL